MIRALARTFSRSPRELAFRLRQEIANLWLAASRPAVSVEQPAPLAELPPPEPIASALKGTVLAEEIIGLAERILEHRFPLLGLEIDAGNEIHWRRDYQSEKESPSRYFRLLPYLDFHQIGDHKVIWELNRHQHLTLLAQALLMTGREEFLREIELQWRSWTRANPFQRGINWASALEVAFRACSWIWIYHLIGERMDADWRREFLTGLYRHGLHLEYNLSVYFSPNTHLLGEAVALHALGVLFPSFPRARRWKRIGGEIVRQQLTRQVLADGAHFERSSYYHVYALDMFLFHYAMAGRPADFRPVLERMAEYLNALLGPARADPSIGDDDGGRFFHPYGSHSGYGRATLATCSVLFDRQDWHCEAEDLHPQAAWWFGVGQAVSPAGQIHSSRLFPQSGTAIMTSGGLWVRVDAGGFGPFQAGHSHSDALSLVARWGAEELLIDPGTYTYVADGRWRDWFRGSAAHNTIRVDGLDQATAAGPFAWKGRPRVEVLQWSSTQEHDYLDAVCHYSEVTHRRRFFLEKPDLLWIVDEVDDGRSGERWIEQFWHTGEETVPLSPNSFRIGSAALLVLGGAAVRYSRGEEHGWRSRAMGQKEPSPVLIAGGTLKLPAILGAALTISPETGSLTLECRKRGAGTALRLSSGREVHFPDSGLPNRVTEPSR